MSIIQSLIIQRSTSPVITGMSLGDQSGAQITVPYTNVPTVVGGAAPLTFSGVNIPNGLSVNASNGTISGVPTSPGDYYGLQVNCSLTATDAQLRANTRNLTIFVFTAPELGFEPAAPRSYTGTSGVRGIVFNDQDGLTTPRCHRMNNGGFLNPIRWWGPLDAGFPGWNQFEARWSIISGTPSGFASAQNVWINTSLVPDFSLQTAGSFTVELRPVNGASVGAATFTFS